MIQIHPFSDQHVLEASVYFLWSQTQKRPIHSVPTESQTITLQIGETAVQRTLAVLTSDQMISNFCSSIWTVIKLEHYPTDFPRENLNWLGQEMEF
jgi:hypothetical protein